MTRASRLAARQARSHRSRITQIVDRLEAERPAGEKLISLVEVGPPSSRLSERQLNILESQTSDRLAYAGVQLLYEHGEGRFYARLCPGNRVGTTRFVKGADYVDVVVEPKVGNADFLKLLDYAQAGLVIGRDEALAYSAHHDTATSVVALVVSRVVGFLERAPFRGYARKYDPGSRKPRGRWDVRRFASDMLPRLRYDIMPCEYFEYSANVIENQVLSSTLFIAGRLAASMPATVRARTSRLIARGRRALHGVDVRRFQAQDLERIFYTSQNRHFEPIHNLCRLLLLNSTVSLSPGRRLTFVSFSIRMGDLFESFVRALLTNAFGRRQFPEKAKIQFPIGTRDREMKLDGLLLRGESTTVVECKYKVVEATDLGDFRETSIDPADIYQVVAYASHRRIAAKNAVLIYPSVDASQPAVRSAVRLESFLNAVGGPLSITVILLNLTKDPDVLRNELSNSLTHL